MKTTFDYIVIGAGSAGSVIASRLSENPNCSVLVIEAGPDNDVDAVKIPSQWPNAWQSERDWQFSSTPQKNAGNVPKYIPRGKTLGGSSSINGLIYIRGVKEDYDNWAYEGCYGWDYESVLPYFKKSENYEMGADEIHGGDGPLYVTKIKEPNPISDAAIKGCQELGHEKTDDFASKTLGAGYCDLTASPDGLRCSTAEAFLKPAANRENLEITTESEVHRLVLEGDQCVGVVYEKDGETITVTANKEVILSAGAIGSPHILMLSGIGDKAHLKEVGITPKKHVPGVGKNLQDHLLCSVIFKSKKDIPAPKANLLEAQIFLKSNPEMKTPDLQPLFMGIPYYAPGFEGPEKAFTLCAGMIRPKSRGTVKLKSNDPKEAPLIDPNYLAEQADFDALYEGVKFCRELGNTKALEEWTEKEVYPGENCTPEEVRKYIRAAASTYHHVAGTCKMGVDQNSVVDPTLKVRGIKNLRVADASIMPSITSGNTNAPTIMIGEKAADLIKNQQ